MSGQDDDLMAIREQRLGESTSDQAGSPGDYDFHSSCLSPVQVMRLLHCSFFGTVSFRHSPTGPARMSGRVWPTHTSILNESGVVRSEKTRTVRRPPNDAARS